MTDKVQKILSEIATRKLCTMDEHMAFHNDKAKEDYWLLSEIEDFIKDLQEDPVSEDLEETINTIKLLTSNTALLTFEYGFRKGAKWQEKKDQETGIIKGTEHTIGKVRSILNKVAYENNGLDVNGDYCEQPYIELDSEFRKLLKEE